MLKKKCGATDTYVFYDTPLRMHKYVNLWTETFLAVMRGPRKPNFVDQLWPTQPALRALRPTLANSGETSLRLYYSSAKQL
eukprot:6033575-Amphidinium_carterae.1